MPSAGILQERVTFSETRILEFRHVVSEAVPELALCKNLCIYTTGSFGRREAGKNSDLDLFFVHAGERKEITNHNKTLIDADLIRLCEKRLEYPAFSSDGVYLKIHTINDLSTKIGHQQEDAENVFTARMLLFLESTSLHNDEVYQQAISACVQAYCRDYEDHATNFHPRFLANDIMRFWKTLCLNYESARTGATKEDKPKHWLKNLKLKFSRMMTCFSMLACLCDPQESNTPDKLAQLVQMTPAARLEHITSKHRITELFGSLMSEYEWFLHETDREKPMALAWIADNKDDVFRRSKVFGDQIFHLLECVAEKTETDLRYLVV
jgi:Nucleotidyltransferase domain